MSKSVVQSSDRRKCCHGFKFPSNARHRSHFHMPIAPKNQAEKPRTTGPAHSFGFSRVTPPTILSHGPTKVTCCTHFKQQAEATACGVADGGTRTCHFELVGRRSFIFYAILLDLPKWRCVSVKHEITRCEGVEDKKEVLSRHCCGVVVIPFVALAADSIEVWRRRGIVAMR